MNNRHTDNPRRPVVFLTGATGVMGTAGLKELRDAGTYDIRVLVRDSKTNRRKMAGMEDVDIIWGDLCDYSSVRRGVKGADYVLHVGGMVSPSADWHPEQCWKVNTTAMKNILKAIGECGQKESVRLVYIGSVAQYGPHNPPHHWGSAQDPQNPAKFDRYADSKVEAERLLRESGVKYWVSLRQSGILHPGLLFNASDPIAFHVPVEGVLEWATVEDSGRLLERVCRPEVPEDFWCKSYNISSGSTYRLTNYEFELKLLSTLGLGRPEEVFEAWWFATGNFHGMWYSDGDKLEEALHFRSGETADEWFGNLKSKLPWYFSLARIVPSWCVKMYMGRVARNTPLSPMRWIADNNEERIKAAWGSRAAWEKLRKEGWSHYNLTRPSDALPPSE